MAAVERNSNQGSGRSGSLDLLIGALAGAISLMAVCLAALSLAEWSLQAVGATLTLAPMTGLAQAAALVVGALWGGLLALRQA